MEKEKFNYLTQEPLKTSKLFSSFPSLSIQELLKRKPVELAHKIISQKIEIEELNEGFKTLKQGLKQMKERNQNMNIYHQEILHKVNSEAEEMVQRHQKLIKQLIEEKKKLNEIMSHVANHFKLEKLKFNQTLKEMEEKFHNDIKRIKETQMVTNKIKRDKWMETKIKKIKEMTIKGLEPELSRLASNQQKEISDIRNLHKIELEAVELKAARRTTELMNQLRVELENEKNNAVAKEMHIFQNRLQKDFEQERRELLQVQEELKQKIKKEEEKLINKEDKFRQDFLNYQEKVKKEKQEMLQNFHKKLLESKKYYLMEINNLKESLKSEKDIWINNYKQQENQKFIEKEKELHHKYKIERDRDIDVIIDTFEKESAEIRVKLNKISEKKMIKLKEQLENEIKKIEANEIILKTKLTEANSQILVKEEKIIELNSQIRLLQTELLFFKQSSETLAVEKSRLKDNIKQDFENTIDKLVKKKQDLEKELLILKNIISKESIKKEDIDEEVRKKNQEDMNFIINRLHTALNKKETTIQILRQKEETINMRCRELEFLLDNQRSILLK